MNYKLHKLRLTLTLNTYLSLLILSSFYDYVKYRSAARNVR